ncbi:MAG TPA: aminotransferase class V-fold PLP-dependent enzyme [Kofleriaceae bacterium]|nr:aminotransferase class V-fold PLP-dependent enzyme [Kofleriaceae bacterium]
MQTIYLDSAASTRVDEDVIARMAEVMRTAWGNPSSAHPQGAAGRRWIEAARVELLAALGDGGAGDVVFTSGCTESDAIGVLGGFRARGRGRVVVSAIEHPAVGATADMIDLGEVVRVPATKDGVIDLEALERAIDPDAAVVALVVVQNEIGTLQPYADAARIARRRAPDCHVHLDAAQAIGKVAFDAAASGADSIAIAGHKIGGPKGAGALWLRRGARVVPLWSGGGQQGGLRSGTQDAPGASGLALACTHAVASRAESAARWGAMRARLIEAAAQAGVPWLEIAAGAPRSPHIVALAFERVAASALRNTLSSRGVYISTGSACADRDSKPSAVLQALGLGNDFGVARFSFERTTTAEEVEMAASILCDAVKSLAR